MKKYILGLIAVLALGVWFSLTQLYTQDSETTATKGIFFTKTLQLNSYKKISTGKDRLWFLKGTYNNYSRSDRHNELVTVYCNKYCAK